MSDAPLGRQDRTPRIPTVMIPHCGAEFDPAARAVAAPADPTMRRLISFLSFDLHKDSSRRMEGWSNAR
jgi:hypothetical protein